MGDRPFGCTCQGQPAWCEACRNAGRPWRAVIDGLRADVEREQAMVDRLTVERDRWRTLYENCRREARAAIVELGGYVE